jgi:succinoglycan biosynthesis transport protein ExoP
MSRKKATSKPKDTPHALVPSSPHPGHSTPPVRKANPAPNALALLKALRRRWLSATICGLLASVFAAAGVWLGMPMKYTASTILHVSAQEPRVLGGDTAGYSDFSLYQKSQAAMVVSRLVLNAVLKDAEVARLSILPRNPDQQIERLQQELKVDFKTGPEFMRISMVGSEPDEMKVLLNSVAAVYLKEVVNKERIKKQNRLNHLKEIQSKYEETLRNRREAVRNLVLALGSGDAQVLAVKQRYATEALGVSEKELQQIQSELRRIKIELNFREGRAKSSPPEVPVSLLEQEINKDPAVAQLLVQQEHQKKKLEQAAKLALRGNEEPALQPMVDQIKSTEAELEAARNRLRSEVKERLLARVGGDLSSSVIELRRRLEFSQELEKSLLESVERMRKQTASTNVGQADVEMFRQEITQAEKLSERVAAEVENLKVEVDAPRRVELLEDASASMGALERQRTKATAGASVAALFFVVGLISWREYRYRRLDSAHELTQDLGMKVVGTLPVHSAPTRSLLPWRSASTDAWQDILTECVDATRTSLLHTAREKDTRVVLVTSALGGEGKTSLSCHLAGSLARAGFRTLLIDGDMRRPSIHRVLNVATTKGFSELLRKQVELDAVIHATDINHLWIIAGGQWDQSATAALARSRLPDILKTLREQYEYIIIDSAPLLPVVDSLLLGQHADGVVLSVLREVSQLPLVNSAAERLEAVGVRILGVIVNGATADVHAYRYAYTPELAAPAADTTDIVSV